MDVRNAYWSCLQMISEHWWLIGQIEQQPGKQPLRLFQGCSRVSPKLKYQFDQPGMDMIVKLESVESGKEIALC